MTAIVQSSSPSSIQCGSPTPNDELRQNLHLGNSHFDPPPSSMATDALNALDTDAEQEGGEEREKNWRREQEEEEDQLSVLALFVTAFRNSLVRCYNKVGEGSVSSSSSPWAKEMEIGLPTNVRHVAHVTFDRFNGFLGLPVEFEPEVPRRAPSASTTVFGVSTNSMQLAFDSRGNSVPSILLRMQRRLYALRGLEVEGIFRITAGSDQEEYVRDQLNRGVVPDDADVHCLAGLIKAWFRELPTGLLDSLSPEQLNESQTEEEHVQLARTLPLTEAFLLDWAVNLMADIAQHEHLNKMDPRNVAVVFAPNMTHVLDPLTALMHAVQVMNFLKTLIVRRLREREDLFLDAPLPTNEPSDESAPPSLLQPAVEGSGEWFDAENDLMTHKPGSEDHLRAHLLEEGAEANYEGPGFLNSIENILSDKPPPVTSVAKDDNASSSRGARTLRDQLIKPSLEKAQKKDNQALEKNKGTKVVSCINPRSQRIEAWR